MPEPSAAATNRLAPDESEATGLRGGGRAALTALGLAALVGLVAGVLTAWGQSWLPSQLTSLANSVGSWSLIAFLLALAARTVRSAMVSGAVALAALLVGYDVASELRGYPAGSSLIVFWGAAAVIAGPLLGLAAHWTRRGGRLAGIGIGAMSGVLVGEGSYSLRYIADTTYPPYWWTETGVGVVLVLAAATLRRWSAGTMALAAVTPIAVAAAFLVIYHASGGLIGAL